MRVGGEQTSEKRDGEKGTGISTRRGKKEGTRRREEHVRKREIAKENEEEEVTKKMPWCDWKTRWKREGRVVEEEKQKKRRRRR